MASGFAYDGALHALFVGFVFSMVFGHAPIIVPAVLDRPIHFRRAFYGHLALLHLSLMVRVGGDLLEHALLRQVGSVGNAVAIGLFIVMTATSARRGRAPAKGLAATR